MRFITVLLFGVLVLTGAYAVEGVRVIEDSVRVRRDAGEKGRVVAYLRKGALVEVLEKTEELDTVGEKRAPWYRIRTGNNKEGWVFGGALDVDAETVDVSPQEDGSMRERGGSVQRRSPSKWWHVKRTGQQVDTDIAEDTRVPMKDSEAPAKNDFEQLLEQCKTSEKDEVIGSRAFAGKLDGFVHGDSFRALVVNENDKTESFISRPEESCFMAQQQEGTLEIQYDIACKSLPYDSSLIPQNIITQIKTGNADFETWKQTFDVEGDKESCKELVQRYTREP